MKITIKLTEKEKELYKKSGSVASLYSYRNVTSNRLVVYGGNWYVNDNGYALGKKLRKELYKKLKELEK